MSQVSELKYVTYVSVIAQYAFHMNAVTKLRYIQRYESIAERHISVYNRTIVANTGSIRLIFNKCDTFVIICCVRVYYTNNKLTQLIYNYPGSVYLSCSDVGST